MRHASARWLWAAALPILILACAGPRKLKPEQTYLNLRPVEPLPVYDLEKIPVNMEVVIDNVADMGTSYKNYARLYINGYEIQPEEPVSNVQSTYTYRLKLQPGIYDIRGEYYALDGFVERKYDIRPQTKVMVKPGQLTKVRCRIEKNWDGTPESKTLLFSVTYVPLERQAEPKPAVSSQPKPMRRASKAPETAAPPKKQEQRTIVLQVNTSPPGADVIIDDRYIGQSPLRVLVDRTSSHILQLNLDGYEGVIKYLDHAQFGEENVIYFMQKLKPKHHPHEEEGHSL